MGYNTLLYEKKDGIGIITFNNPANLNAMSNEFIAEYKQVLQEVEKDDSVCVIIVTGAGKAFIAGADITLMKDMSPTEAALYSANTTEMYRMMETMPKVFIAAINGFAFGGGCEFALACDIRIASTRAKMGLPEVSLGILPGGGGTQRLPRLIGMGKAKELIFTAKTINAEEAEKLGMLNEVCEPEELLQKAEEIAQQIMKNSKDSIGLAKQSINVGAQMDLESAMNLEKNLFAMCFATENQKEGMTAFIEKRKPAYK